MYYIFKLVALMETETERELSKHLTGRTKSECCSLAQVFFP